MSAPVNFTSPLGPIMSHRWTGRRWSVTTRSESLGCSANAYPSSTTHPLHYDSSQTGNACSQQSLLELDPRSPSVTRVDGPHIPQLQTLPPVHSPGTQVYGLHRSQTRDVPVCNQPSSPLLEPSGYSYWGIDQPYPIASQTIGGNLLQNCPTHVHCTTPLICQHTAPSELAAATTTSSLASSPLPQAHSFPAADIRGLLPRIFSYSADRQ
jgi:hypothetical protein